MRLGPRLLQLGLLRLLLRRRALPLAAQRLVAVVMPRLLAQPAHLLLLRVAQLAAYLVVALGLAARGQAVVARPHTSAHLVERLVVIHLGRARGAGRG